MLAGQLLADLADGAVHGSRAGPLTAADPSAGGAPAGFRPGLAAAHHHAAALAAGTGAERAQPQRCEPGGGDGEAGASPRRGIRPGPCSDRRPPAPRRRSLRGRARERTARDRFRCIGRRPSRLEAGSRRALAGGSRRRPAQRAHDRERQISPRLGGDRRVGGHGHPSSLGIGVQGPVAAFARMRRPALLGVAGGQDQGTLRAHQAGRRPETMRSAETRNAWSGRQRGGRPR